MKEFVRLTENDLEALVPDKLGDRIRLRQAVQQAKVQVLISDKSSPLQEFQSLDIGIYPLLAIEGLLKLCLHCSQRQKNALLPFCSEFGQSEGWPHPYEFPWHKISSEWKDAFESSSLLDNNGKKYIAVIIFNEFRRYFLIRPPPFYLNLLCFMFVNRFVKMHDGSATGFESLKILVQNKFRFARKRKMQAEKGSKN